MVLLYQTSCGQFRNKYIYNYIIMQYLLLLYYMDAKEDLYDLNNDETII
jgi:hypothetical protein